MIRGNFGLAGPETIRVTAPGAVIADRGGLTVGRVEYQRPAVASQSVRLRQFFTDLFRQFDVTPTMPDVGDPGLHLSAGQRR